jgi:SulP family sulfate permease
MTQGGQADKRAGRLSAGDAIAGVSIALVLIPQSLAYARVAGLPAYVGLYAAILPPIVASFFASSPYLQTGPVAVTAVLTAGALAGLAAPGSPEYVGLAALLAMIVGVVRIGIGTLGLGRVVYLMSEPVLRGFTAGAALLIVASQIPGLLGVQAGGNPIPAAVSAVLGWRAWDAETLAIGATALLVILISRRIHALVPWALIVTAGGLAWSAGTGYDGAVVGVVPEGVMPLSLRLPWGAGPLLTLPGVVIAMVGFAEAASISRMFAARERQPWDPDREFVSQGAANVAAAVSGGFPVGGSFSRSSMARMLGATTRWSGALTGLTVLLFLPFASVLAPLPVAVLSAMVITAVAGLIRIRPILEMWQLSRPQFLVASGTLLLSILLSPRIDHAVLLGILLAVGVHLWREFDVKVATWLEQDVLHVRPEGVLWFGSAEALKQDVQDLMADKTIARLVLHMERAGRVDLTASLVLEQLVEQARSAGIATEVTAAHPVTARALHRVLGTHADPDRGDTPA